MKNIRKISPQLTLEQVINECKDSKIFLIKIPSSNMLGLDSLSEPDSIILKVCALVDLLSSIDDNDRTLAVMGPMYLLPYVYHSTNSRYLFKSLIALRLAKTESAKKILPNEHLGVLVVSACRYGALNEVKKPYEYCKSCGDTVKDYGGKKYLLVGSGTRISDVWTDVLVDAKKAIPHAVAERLFSLINHKNAKLTTFAPTTSDISRWEIGPVKNTIWRAVLETPKPMPQAKKILDSKLFNMDVFDGLRKIPDSVVDLALVDPPYNLRINYGNYSDDMGSTEYVEWCKRWIGEISRALRPGGTLALVGMPRWSLELFPYMQQRLSFHCWIVWDSFSYPHSPVIPAHYPILCFSKGKIRPGLTREHARESSEDRDLMNPLNYGYCIRSKCVNARTSKMNQDRKVLSDLWTDIHRIRHNSFRYNHPTLMPQRLARRLILTFSKKEDMVLDCFNGIGTTSLVSRSLGRRYIGIEKNPIYFETSVQRHRTLEDGGDPFARGSGRSTRSNKGYRAVKPQVHVEKTLLLNEVKTVAVRLGRIPSENELETHGRYPLIYYHDNFTDWAEVTAVARRAGLAQPTGASIYELEYKKPRQ